MLYLDSQATLKLLALTSLAYDSFESLKKVQYSSRLKKKVINIVSILKLSFKIEKQRRKLHITLPKLVIQA